MNNQGEYSETYVRAHKRLHLLPFFKASNAGTNCEFTIAFNNAEYLQESITTVQVHHWAVPNLFYSVWPGANRLAYGLASDTTQGGTITLPTGYYTESEVIAAIVAALLLEPDAGVTVATQDPLTLAWSFELTRTSDGGQLILLPFGEGATGTPPSNHLATHIGAVGQPTIAGALQVLNGVVLMDSPNEVHLRLDQFGSHGINSQSENTQFIEVLDLSQAARGQLAAMRQTRDDAHFAFKHASVNRMKVTLVDKYGTLLLLPENVYPSIILDIGIK